MAIKHPIEILDERLDTIIDYPEGVSRVPCRLTFFAFYPAGCGLPGVNAEGPLPPVREGGVMVLGHNFYSFSGFEKQQEQKKSDWRYRTGATLKDLLPKHGIPLEHCFFTNFFLGLGDANTGAFVGAKSESFVQTCRDFLRFQLQVIRPRVVLVLGLHTPPLLSPLAPQLASWAGCSSFQRLDDRGLNFIDGVEVDGVRYCFVVLTHPSMRGSNVHRRHFREVGGDESVLVGDAAEAAMLALARERL